MAETIISPGVFQRENDISFIQPAPVEAGAAIIGPTVKGPVEIPTTVTSYNDYVRQFGETFESGSDVHEFFTSMAVKNYFQQGGNSVLVTRVVNGTFTQATATAVTAGDGGDAPFVLKTIGKGTIYNNGTSQNSDSSLVDGKEDNVRYEISNVNDEKGTFSVSIRRGDDNKNNKIILETFNNVNLDPNSTNYIARVIGNQVLALNGDATQVDATGSYVNNSNYVYVSEVGRPTLNYLGNDGAIRLGSLSGSLPTAQSGSFTGATGAVAGGANFYDNINSSNTQGLQGSDYSDAITLLGNTDAYKFNVVSAPGIYNADFGSTVDSLISLVETRGDAIAVVDLVKHGQTVSAINSQAADLNSSYGAAYWPWLQTQTGAGKFVWAPASTFIPGTYAFTDNSSAPWFAPAGLVRGGLSGVTQAEKKLSRSDRDSLYSNKVNPIATFPGTGLAVFGQKTLQSKASALDRVNVRRLLIELKEFIGNQADTLVFEQNTLTTRNRFLSAVNPYLESVVQRQGLYAYRVVMDDTNNTADVIDRNQLVGQIFIQPAKTAEFIILDFVVEPTGATFGA